MEVLAIREGDLDYPDEMMLPFLVNAFTDDNILRFVSAASSSRPRNSSRINCGNAAKFSEVFFRFLDNHAACEQLSELHASPYIGRRCVHVSTVPQIQSPGFRIWRFAALSRRMVKEGL
jgi:hypothetical protein